MQCKVTATAICHLDLGVVETESIDHVSQQVMLTVAKTPIVIEELGKISLVVTEVNTEEIKP